MNPHPIDAEIRAWLKRHVDNQADLSVAVGHSKSWLGKYINGAGHATIDDLVKLAGRLLGVDLPALSDVERRLLRACQSLSATDVLDVTAYAEHRARLARRGGSKESSEPVARTLPTTTRTTRGIPRGGKAGETTNDGASAALGHLKK
jgi:transcriptional regulator with XRE-family HTH domain